MSHHHLEDDLAHLERVVPRLFINTQQARVYWTARITALKVTQTMVPNGAQRVKRLLILLDRFDANLGSHMKVP